MAASCTGTETNCNPNTLKQSANGISYGLSSLRQLPSGDFWGYEDVSGSGDNALWDYNNFAKVGAVMSAFNKDYFFAYDVSVVEENKLLRVSVHKWSIAGDVGKSRRENC